MNHAEFTIAYNKQATDPHNWLARALGNWISATKIRDLYDASTYRGKKSGDFNIGQATGGSYLMLVGYALECLAKGVIVHKNSGRYWNGQTFLDKVYSQDIYSHELADLFSRCQVSLSDIETAMINGVQEYVVWAGRYPFAKNADKAIQAFAQHKLPDGWPWDWDILTDHHYDLADLCLKLIEEIPNSEFYARFYKIKMA